jgi:peptidoglycan/xylan/chitin deacetylase (PgdA/CDA1 family)
LSWEHVEEMKERGFVIGSHTVSHANLAAVSEAEVEHELTESRDTLRRRLGLEDLLFAYPFGGRANVTDRVLELVRACGYKACFSAYGGVNDGVVDLFDIRRFGINHRVSMACLASLVHG